MAELTKGVYALTHDVTNPKPDRRSKKWVNHPEWKKDDRVIISTRYGRLQLEGFGESYDGVSPRDPRWTALEGALEPTPPRVAELFQLYGMDSLHPHVFARYCVEMGLLTMAQVDAVCRKVDE